MVKNIKEYDELLYENRFNNNIIIKNYKTHVYESFNEEGIVNYKIVFIQKEDNFLYFKLVNEEAIIKYDINKFILYKINLNDFYLKKNNYIEYDKKKILFNTWLKNIWDILFSIFNLLYDKFIIINLSFYNKW